MAKRYYWLKLKENFFNSPHLKAMRKLPGGTELCIIYLKMMLQSIKNEGVLLHTLETNSFADELSFVLEENSQSIDMVLHFLIKNHLIEQIEDDTFLLPEAQNCIGSESESAERVRKYREKDKSLQIYQNSKTLHCNNNVTALHCNTDTDKDINNNNSNKNININKDKYEDKEELSLVIEVLKEIDIQESVAAELYKKYGKETIFLALADMKNRKGINRPGGYLIKMLQQKWPISKNTIEQIENIKKQKEKEELQLYKEKASKFCLSCNKWEEKGIFCSHDGMRLEKDTLRTIKCEFCEVENE